MIGTGHAEAQKQGKGVVGAYETHLFTMKAARKRKITAFFLPVLNMGNLDQSASLHNNDRLIILQNQKFYAVVHFRFQHFLQFMTVPPKLSDSEDVPSESLAPYVVNGLSSALLYLENGWKEHNSVHSEASKNVQITNNYTSNAQPLTICVAT